MEELFAKIATGDREAFEQLYKNNFSLIFGIVYGVLDNHAQSEEVTQDVFLELWSTAARYNPDRGSERRWMTTIARRRAVDRARSAQAARVRETRAAMRDVGAEPGPAEHAELHLDAQNLHRALRRLQPGQRDLLVTAYLRGVPYRELAQLQNVPVNTVKSRVRRALSELRRVREQLS